VTGVVFTQWGGGGKRGAFHGSRKGKFLKKNQIWFPKNGGRGRPRIREGKLKHGGMGVFFPRGGGGVTEGLSMVTDNVIFQINTASARKTTSKD